MLWITLSYPIFIISSSYISSLFQMYAAVEVADFFR
ncbi:MAG: hypothetical protein UX75_C0007G0038 [Candidatus Moranbacteria bacterium GW2011_GWE2_47_10]|nr:MAG: hypothetical protein UX75_C0007G0038 [Candidatus Moranbacteria bacterium GW2011_GWE2_47_10]